MVCKGSPRKGWVSPFPHTSGDSIAHQSLQEPFFAHGWRLARVSGTQGPQRTEGTRLRGLCDNPSLIPYLSPRQSMPIPTSHPKDLGPKEPHSTTPFRGPSILSEQSSLQGGRQAASRLPPYLILADPGMLWEDARIVPGLSCQQCPPGANHKETSTEPKFRVNYNITGFSKMSRS